jgi:alpha-beta hydrolase superfamily lysophospholipase
MKWMRPGSLAAGLCLTGAAGIGLLGVETARTTEQTISLGGLQVTVWSRPAAASQPVIVFSHGFHGCATQSRFLMTALADDGYLVFAPNHADATCNGGTAAWADPPEARFGQPQIWTDATFRDRADDIRRLVAAIRSDPRFRARADFNRFALAGHSLGGYTVLGLAGAWPTWEMPEVRAVLALSPYDQPFVAQSTLDGLSAPVMYQGGTLDFGITPSLKRGGYDQSPAPKYFAEFSGAGHLAWTNIGRPASRPDIVAYSLAFLDYYARGASPDPLLTRALPGVSVYRYESELGTNGAGETGR